MQPINPLLCQRSWWILDGAIFDWCGVNVDLYGNNITELIVASDVTNEFTTGMQK